MTCILVLLRYIMSHLGIPLKLVLLNQVIKVIQHPFPRQEVPGKYTVKGVSVTHLRSDHNFFMQKLLICLRPTDMFDEDTEIVNRKREQI